MTKQPDAPAAERRPQPRDDRNGRYDYSGGMDRVCVCGHTLGVHAAGVPHECFTYQFSKHDPNYDPTCHCPKFRQSRKGASKVTKPNDAPAAPHTGCRYETSGFDELSAAQVEVIHGPACHDAPAACLCGEPEVKGHLHTCKLNPMHAPVALPDVEVWNQPYIPFVRNGIEPGWYWHDKRQRAFESHGPFPTEEEAREDARRKSQVARVESPGTALKGSPT